MELSFNVRHLEEKDLHLKGELPVEALELEGLDELVHFSAPLQYDLQIAKSGNGILVTGRLELPFECECARCLKRFPTRLFRPDWASHLALEGEEKVPVDNDLIDLTPILREDILIEFPQHPLCNPECQGLPKGPLSSDQAGGLTGQETPNTSPWSELNKLKLKR